MPDPTGRISHVPEMHRGEAWKQPCRVATTANVTIASDLNAGDTIDGVVLVAGDRVLVKDQSTGSQNGIYVAGTSPARAFDMDQDGSTSVPAEEVIGAFVYVYAGTANGGKLYRATNTSAPTLGSTTLTFSEFASSGTANAILRYGGAAEWYYNHGGAAVGTTETIDLANGNAHSIILDENCTLTFTGAVSSISGQAVSCAFTLKVVQDASGGNTITWPGSVVWPGGSAPSLSTTANAVEILAFWTDDGGTTWFGFHASSSATPVDWAEAGDIADVGTTAAAGSSVETPRADHVHALTAATVTSLGFSTGPGAGDHEHMIDVFNGDAVTTAFEISDEPLDPEAVFAFVGGSWTAITVSGTMNTTITFGSAPASGTGNVVVQYPAVAA